MKLRCKDGDLAVITWDHPGCRQNIGRVVQVQGPVRDDGYGPAWRIRPITENLYMFLDLDGSIGRESVTWDSRIDHPDAWMMPIRPRRRRSSTSLKTNSVNEDLTDSSLLKVVASEGRRN